MKGLTTRFDRPAPPKPGLITRETLGIPHRPLVPGDAQQYPGLATTAAEAAAAAAAAAEAFRKSDETERVIPDGEQQMLSSSCGALYLVPQTLYKIHPDFDRLVAGVLSLDRFGCVVFIRALETSTTEALVRRMSRTLFDAGVGSERVVFVPRWVVLLQ